MIRSVLLVFFQFLLLSVSANTYYSTNSTAPNTTTNWHTARNGTGSTPANFTGVDIFIIQAGHYLTTTANWVMSGTNAKLLIETGATLNADHKVTVDIFQMDGTSAFIHNDNTATFPGDISRTLASTSTVEITNWNGSAKLPAPTTWGSLIIDMPGYGSNLSQAGELTNIAGDFIIRSTGISGKEFRLAGTQDYTLTIGGNLIIEGGTLEASSGNGNANQVIIINGSFLQSGGEFTRSNTNANVLQIQFNGANSNFTKSAGVLTNTYMNWQVNTSKKLTLSNDLPVASSRSVTINGTLDFVTKFVTGAGSFTVGAGGTLITSNTLGLNGSIGVTGTSTLTAGASYQFLSATSTAFPSSVVSVSANNITTDADVTFNRNVTVTGTLTLSSGKLIIPAGNTVTVSSGNSVAGSGFGTTKQIVTQVNTSTGAKGYFRIQNYTGTTSVPVGNGNYYLPVTLTATGANDFSICVFSGITSNGQPNGTAFTVAQKKSLVDAVWTVNRNGGAGDVMMQLAWPDALEGTLFQTLAGSQIGIAHYGTIWEASFGTGSQAPNSATRSAITSFSPFGVGQSGMTLPLKFGDIKALQKNDGVQVDWFSYTEINLDHYEVERSTDGRNFASLAQKASAGNSESRKDYSWTDNVVTDGIFFYRIKGVDKDGGLMYSPVVRISVSQHPANEMILYPNPVVGKRITVQATYLSMGSYKLNVYDQNGRSLYEQNFEHGGGAISQQIQLPSSLMQGVYILAVSSGSEVKMSKSFILK